MNKNTTQIELHDNYVTTGYESLLGVIKQGLTDLDIMVSSNVGQVPRNDEMVVYVYYIDNDVTEMHTNGGVSYIDGKVCYAAE